MSMPAVGHALTPVAPLMHVVYGVQDTCCSLSVTLYGHSTVILDGHSMR